MNLVYTSGCTCTSLSVGGRELNLELTKDERSKLAKKILEITSSSKVLLEAYDYWAVRDLLYVDSGEYKDDLYYSKISKFELLPLEAQRRMALWLFKRPEEPEGCFPQEIFIKYLESEGQYKFDYHCPTCGDSVCHWTIEDFPDIYDEEI